MIELSAQAKSSFVYEAIRLHIMEVRLASLKLIKFKNKNKQKKTL